MNSEDVRCFGNIGRLSVYLFENNRDFKSAVDAHLPSEGRLSFSPPQSYSQKTLRIKTNCLNYDFQDYRIDRIITNDEAAATRMESLYPLLSQVWKNWDRQTGSTPGLQIPPLFIQLKISVAIQLRSSWSA